MGTQLRSSTKLLFVVAMALGLGLAWPASRAGAVPLIDGYGGAAGYGTDFLPPNDDGSSSAIDLTGSFPGGLLFFGGPYTTMYVNTNGNITFNGPLPTYTPNPFPVASQPMIAPYWGDVDIRGSGFPARNGVWWVLLPGRIVITWNHVGYYSIHDDKEMDFQMILTNSIDCGEGDFDVEFRYNVCGWTTGDASGGSGGFGGTPAQAGFDAGNLMDFVELPGSRTMSILDLCTTSNVGEPGIWRFSVRNGTVSCPGTGEPCDTGELGVCAAGLTQCIAGGVECLGVGTASAERCDGLDNDCNGATDDGMLCTEHEVCANGQCVPACFEGGCFAGDTCTAEGFCVETACIDVTCPPGERCVGGSCVAACTDVVCPHGRVCLAGRCVDVCDVVTCGDGSICVDGACVRRCPCSPCPEGSICAADGSCIPLG
ncbi:MAG: hypothetical protein IT379_29725, partial [Deltaproteobacteria bacterium]|nr:hypothetical protein [Deltaproteobacteria bacterium]